MSEKRTPPAGEEPEAKRARVTEEYGAEVATALEEVEKVQEKLKKVDDECVKQQMLIQSKCEVDKKPFFEERQKVLEKIPSFWGQALWRHPSMAFITEEDKAILKHLKSLSVDDSLDVYGSYKVTMVFDDGASNYFSPLTLTKHVEFSHDPQAERKVKEMTEIKFKDGKDPRVKPREMREKGDGSDSDIVSFFDLFTSEAEVTDPSTSGFTDFVHGIGESLRRLIWHAPHESYLGECDVSDDEDFSDGDDDDEDDDESEKKA